MRGAWVRFVRRRNLALVGEAADLVDIGAARTRLEATVGRGLTWFVGRHVEVRAIEAAMSRAHAGHGQVVAPVGERSVGKSRIVREVARSERLDGWAVLEADALSHGTSTPYLPVIRIHGLRHVDASLSALTFGNPGNSGI